MGEHQSTCGVSRKKIGLSDGGRTFPGGGSQGVRHCGEIGSNNEGCGEDSVTRRPLWLFPVGWRKSVGTNLHGLLAKMVRKIRLFGGRVKRGNWSMLLTGRKEKVNRLRLQLQRDKGVRKG